MMRRYCANLCCCSVVSVRFFAAAGEGAAGGDADGADGAAVAAAAAATAGDGREEDATGVSTDGFAWP